ncbi:M24 family metallopeptidase [Blastococcus sp. TML/M2B]|uniref:M24 family metallopeptidase n=1 Tax=unclassified Blastococcus TaxID=2619396 RepID=UPI00190CEAF8|nr:MULTISPECIES: M24 family metallopeptidase [unclassified Blastococcus]MBN1092290.1 M24 family metallopeptidase [Blastococcus sp. TML/M2B]MBN1097612.1 M24 family metallopeptidase [Blastococcus sp. TML/C7B]
MSLLAPDPTRTAPLPLRAQAGVRDRWLSERLRDLLPELMDRTGIDLWIVAGREYNEDPVLATLLPATWLSARRRTVLLLHRSDDGVTPVAVSRYPVGQFLPAEPGEGPAGSEWDVVRRFVEQARPARIGIDVSADFALADGLSHGEHGRLVAALGPYADRLVPAEALVVAWLETRLPEEIEALHALHGLIAEVVAEAFATAVTPGVSTAVDVAWWLRQRLHDLGVEPWFHPSVTLQRAGVPLVDQGGALLPAVPFDAVVEPGDLVHCDVGLSSLGLRTDTQHNAYVLQPGEDAAPEGLRALLAAGNRMQDLTVAELRPGRTGNEVLSAARAAATRAGIDVDVYSHPVGVHGHGAGPAIGQWDEQGGVPGPGEHRVHPDTAYALELAVRGPVPEWGGQCVRMGLEQGIALTGAGVRYLGPRQTALVLVPAG